MNPTRFFECENGRRIAYHRTGPKSGTETRPGLVFCGGYKSDMTGTKAVFLENWAHEQGLPFLRFDYSGHGESSGLFEDGSIGEWAEDARAAFDALTEGPQIVIGSSMGGWIALLLARGGAGRIAGLLGIAAAPDFTEDGFWAGFSDEQREAIMRFGRIQLPSEYEDSPYIVTRKLIEDGREHLVLRTPLNLPFPVRLLQGSEDGSVDQSVPLRLMNHAECDDLRLNFVKGEDHSFSTPRALEILANTLREMIA